MAMIPDWMTRSAPSHDSDPEYAKVKEDYEQMKEEVYGRPVKASPKVAPNWRTGSPVTSHDTIYGMDMRFIQEIRYLIDKYRLSEREILYVIEKFGRIKMEGEMR